MVMGYPFLMSQDPINTELKILLPELPRRLIASVLYGIITTLGVVVCAPFLILILACCHTFEMRTRENYRLSLGQCETIGVNRFERLIQTILMPVFVLLENRFGKNCTECVSQERNQSGQSIFHDSLVGNFRKRRKFHARLQLLMALSNKNVETFVPTLTAVGILLCIITYNSLLTLYD